MNKLEKFFNTLLSSNSSLLKKYTTDELTSQIKEYVDFTPYLVQNIYKLLISNNSDDRINGSEILKSLMFQFKLITNFKIEFKNKNEEYLSSTGIEFEGKNEFKSKNFSEQKKILKEIANLEHVENNLVTEIDFKFDSKFCIKKQKIKDKKIENVFDFFENLTNNLLNFEWNKRHGAFLAYNAIFESETKGDIEIKIDSELFNKIYEILKNDKFTDFVEDKATCPVREAASKLLGGIYPRICKNNIIEEIIKFLDDEDWQTQYSGLLAIKNLKDFINNPTFLCNKLYNLLNCKDEDVKYLAAEILNFFFDFTDKNIIFSKCIENLKDNEEISISKVSILNLLKKCNNLEEVDFLYDYFTSPILEVRKSVLDLSNTLRNNSLNFLIGELILIDEKEEIRNEAIKILREKELTEDFLNHFMNILGISLYEPYNTNLFVSYDDSYFTKSGIQSIGKNKILNNRVKLFQIMIRNKGDISYVPSTLIGDVFYKIFNENQYKERNEIIRKRIKKDEEKDNLNILYDKFKDIKLLPMKELIFKLNNPDKLSLHPLGESIFVDFLRWKSVQEYPKISENLINFYKYERSVEFLEFYTSLIIEDYDKDQINLDFFISESYKFLILGYENFLIFFKIFGFRIFSSAFYKNKILKDEKKYKFFSLTIFYYKDNLKDLRFLYEEVMSRYIQDNSNDLNNIDNTNNKDFNNLDYNNTNFSYDNVVYREIIKGFLVDLSYTEDFIDKFLGNLNLNLLDPLISFIDHSFYPVLVKPLLGLTSSSKLFSFIIPRLNFKINQNISAAWTSKISSSKEDLECLLDNKKIKDYKIKCPTTVKLRNYQIEGVRWINFLYNFRLNGILADDMGLGKTIQVLSFICSEIYKTEKKVLVICPSSLTGHWNMEIKTFFPDIKSGIYSKKQTNSSSDVIIVSYDSFRNDHEDFIQKDWFYIILDEGHILRNSNTLLYKRISKFKCRQRLILTGTPVHNSVEDLVSLFNLLMPGYLGNIKDIPFMTSKMSDKELESVNLRLKNLNKQILPFIMRRLKVDVLTDLPPKIIRDIVVEMGPEQRQIYDNIHMKTNTIKDVYQDGNQISQDESKISQDGNQVSTKDDDLSYKSLNKSDGLKRTRDLLNATSHISYFKKSTELSCKFKGLEDIINLYGGEDIKNKILIFFQYKTTIDFVLEDFKKKFNLKYLRLDGSVPTTKRAKIAQDFNVGNIPILFLTTHIGGLGLNLTGADTVIFYEHDWNPFNDLQAMDRAHRIGQKNTVNVFRLITKNSVEEKVMNLQSFKVFIASSIVSQQNADIETMNTKDLLERFTK
ncbi:helicase (MOT1) [Vairimorpha necatrix]|uniref:Helicase (MOT1) n=1 Tax=Vairimorpha necatrix TaxID=6039 RepID=A0AAX4JCG6_9MICR